MRKRNIIILLGHTYRFLIMNFEYLNNKQVFFALLQDRLKLGHLFLSLNFK